MVDFRIGEEVLLKVRIIDGHDGHDGHYYHVEIPGPNGVIIRASPDDLVAKQQDNAVSQLRLGRAD